MANSSILVTRGPIPRTVDSIRFFVAEQGISAHGVDMEMNRRAAIAAAFAVPLAGTTPAAPAAEMVALQPKRGFVLTGVRVFKNRVLDAGRLVPVAEFSHPLVKNPDPHGYHIVDCQYVECSEETVIDLSEPHPFYFHVETRRAM